MRWLPVGLAAAAMAGASAGVHWPWLQAPAWIALAVAAAAGVAAWRAGSPRGLAAAALLALAAVTIARGAQALDAASRSPLLEALAEQRPVDGDARAPITLEGRLDADAAAGERGVVLRLRVRRAWLGRCGCAEAVDDVVLLSVGGAPSPAQIAAWRAGRTLRVVATVRRARGFWNLGAPDPARDRLGRGYGVIGAVKSAWLVEVRGRGPWPLEALAALRAHARAAISDAAAGDATASAIGRAVLIGDRTGLDPAMVARLQRAGTFHVVAISGGNIAVLVLGVTALVRRLVVRRGLVAAIASSVIAAYAVLVGGGASVARATGMALVGLAIMAVDVRSAAVNVLAATSVGLLLAWPGLAVDAGFLLTGLATLGVLVGVAWRPAPAAWWADVASAAVVSSVAAEAAILPILAAVFQQVTIAGPLLNLAAIPGMALVQISAMAVVGLSAVSTSAAAAAGLAMRAGAHLVVETSALVDWWPWLSWHVSPPAWWAVAAYFAAVAAALWCRAAASTAAARVRRWATTAAVMCTVWIAAAPADFVRTRPGTLRLTTFDVGQGDALLVTFPDGTRLAVDGGAARPGGFDAGARVVGPALRARGIRTVDYLLVTHADADHIGGAIALVRDFAPREVWAGIPVDGDEASARLRQAADGVGAAWRPVRSGQHLEIAGVDVAVRHPAEPDWDRQRVRNEDSVVVEVSWRAVRFVLTGDIGADVERLLAPAPSGAARRVVLKVAHHGSAGSSDADYLARLRPDVAIVSAGEGNPFGHPAPATLRRLDAAGADVWRTDLNGEITADTDGRTLTLSSVTGRRRVFTPK